MPYSDPLSETERDFCRWWADAHRSSAPNDVVPRGRFPEFIIYTDAATSTRIVAAVLISPKNFLSDFVSEYLFSETSGPEWEVVFDETTYIYGLEMLDIIAIAIAKGEFLR